MECWTTERQTRRARARAPPCHVPHAGAPAAFVRTAPPSPTKCRQIMASFRSLGQHMPSALPYLVTEGILPDDPSPNLYEWETYYTKEHDEAAYDELLTTEHCVVWSRNGIVRKVFNFKIEEQKVLQAVLTYFPQEEVPTYGNGSLPKEPENASSQEHEQREHRLAPLPPTNYSAFTSSGREKCSRALVIFLKFQAHVFFLRGSSHIINLPFEVEKAFPASIGLILQRRLPSEHRPLTPIIPAPPQNSFFSPLAFSSQSFRLSQPLSAKKPQSLRPSNASGVHTLSDLLRESKLDGPPEDGLPRLYSLIDPLSEMGLVVFNPANRPQSSYSTSTYTAVGGPKLEAIPKDEDLLYVSPSNECPHVEDIGDQPLLFVVSANYVTRKFSLWYTSYITPLPASASSSHGKSISSITGAKPRRRSSYIPGTGATTPTVRAREAGRESFGGPSKTVSRSRTGPNSLSASQQSRDADAEDALASQLDPDHDISGTSVAVKESRRVSSLLSRGDLSTSFDRSAFQEMATQRTSIGGSFNSQSRMGLGFGLTNERTSFGASQTSQSAFRTSMLGDRLSLGVESVDETIEDLMTSAISNDLGGHAELDLLAELGSLEAQEPISGLRKEILMFRFAEIPMGEAPSPGVSDRYDTKSNIRVFTISTLNAPDSSGSPTYRSFIHLTDRSTKSRVAVEYQTLRVRFRPPHRLARTPASLMSQTILVPTVKAVSRFSNNVDALKVMDGPDSCLVTITKAGEEACKLTLHTCISVTIDLERLRLFNPFSFSDTLLSTRMSAGQSRTIKTPQTFRALAHSGPAGTIDVQDDEGCFHRLQIQLRPQNDLVAKALDIFRAVLPGEVGDLIRLIWYDSVRSAAPNLAAAIEWEAFVTAIFALPVSLIPKNRVQLIGRAKPGSRQVRRSGSAQKGKAPTPDSWEIMCNHQITTPGRKTWGSAPWSRITSTMPSEKQFLGRPRKDFLHHSANCARQYFLTKNGVKIHEKLIEDDGRIVREAMPLLVYTLHILREEQKLNISAPDPANTAIGDLCPVLAQLGGWLGWESWSWRPGSWYYIDGTELEEWIWEDVTAEHLKGSAPPFDNPPGIFEWLEKAFNPDTYVAFPTLLSVFRESKPSFGEKSSHAIPEGVVKAGTMRLEAISRYLETFHSNALDDTRSVELMKECGIDRNMLETFPEAVSAVLRETIARCQSNPPTTWDKSLLQLVGREDLDLVSHRANSRSYEMFSIQQSLTAPRDVHTISHAVEQPEPITNSAFADGSMITRLIFSQDQRFLEAAKLVEPLRTQVAECPPDPSWSDTEVLEAQKTVVQYVMTRTFAIAPAQAMLHFDSRRPLPTEKFTIHGYTTMCVMKPMNITVTANREGYTEERYAWAWFHAGVSAGLSISKRAEGIDTSWIVFNKPAELTNRHAGLLLGLGLNGHLKTLAKWLSFKYLTPKHTMTSVGLLLGLSAAFIGTMDTLVTRLLSVHVTRMLPPGAAELNLSPLTQTTGLMGIGLLYYNTQHRRMSEVMISEIEHVEIEDSAGGPDMLRDEGYRLAAGFSLGFINLAKGKELKGLHDMRVVERLLAVAVGPRPVDLVHILDQATAGATIAIALIFMKTEDDAVAKKVNVPDTLPQFDFVRPDILLLRTLAAHLIMWSGIRADFNWVIKNLPREYAGDYLVRDIKTLKSDHMPFFNILAGLLWSVSLKFAGSVDIRVRDFLIHYLDQFIRLCGLPALRYDAKLARNTVRNCQDLIALAAATVMAGTGDLTVFRRLRLLHGRINPDTPYGSHLAAHLAIGVLFLGGGRYTFNTSPLAIAALICAFYPLFPQDVLDNKAHLQAFRHLWVLAAEPRCLIVRDVDTHRAIPMPISIMLKDGTECSANAPCLLPELHTIATIRTTSPEYWPVVLDFLRNPLHISIFRERQTLHVRRRPISEIHGSVFSATLITLNDAQSPHAARLLFNWIYSLSLFTTGQIVDNAEWGLVLPVDSHSSVYLDGRGTIVDQKLGLILASRSSYASKLWNLRCTLRWAKEVVASDGRLRWLGWEVLEELRARVLERSRTITQ